MSTYMVRTAKAIDPRSGDDDWIIVLSFYRMYNLTSFSRDHLPCHFDVACSRPVAFAGVLPPISAFCIAAMKDNVTAACRTANPCPYCCVNIERLASGLADGAKLVLSTVQN
jgi:hypothetical protein